MYLIQIFLPLRDNAGRAISRKHFDAVSAEFTERFGGVTTYSRAPAEGVWRKGGGRAQHDQIIVYEVMAAKLERLWWTQTRKRLERRFRQQELLIRAQLMRKL